MKTFVSNGESLQLIAPPGGVVGGQLYNEGDIVGVVVADAAEGEQFTLKVRGVYKVEKNAGEAWSKGDKLYLVVADGDLTVTAGANVFAGYAASDQVNADVAGDVLLKH